jgi:hypothetical protein
MPRLAEGKVMTLADASALAQIAGVLLVLGSLVFVGAQIRQQTLATKAQTEQAIAANWTALGALISENAEPFTAGLLSTDPKFSQLGDADRMRFLTVIFGLFKHYENMFLQYRKGRIDEADWAPWSNHIEMYFHQPGVQSWWSIRKAAFSPAFRAYLDATQRPAEPSPVALHHAQMAQKPV